MLHPPLEGEGRSRSERGGVAKQRVVVGEISSRGFATQPRLTFRCAQCEPTLPLQGRVEWSRWNRELAASSSRLVEQAGRLAALDEFDQGGQAFLREVVVLNDGLARG